MSVPVGSESAGEPPSGKVMHSIGLRPRAGCETCPDI